jgi:glycosyltransferase involved in cell wall biosynthesis
MLNQNKTLLIVVNVDWFFISHRLCIAKQALKEGWRVVVATRDTGKSQEIKQEGLEFINVPLSRSGKNPLAELKLMLALFIIYSRVNPDIVHHVTLKPVIYGSIVASMTNINGVVNAISGLGYNFTNKKMGLTQQFILFLLKLGFQHKNMAVIFQNKDDYQQLLKMNVFNNLLKTYFIKGSGVDLNKYKPDLKENLANEKVIILYPGRLNWDKGIAELKAASDILKADYFDKISFQLCGKLDGDSKSAVPLNFIAAWEDKRYVHWLGERQDMVKIYQNCDIVVYPSYREGMPKSLLEACAAGKPIVTTNAIGCKACVDEGLNGYKVPVKSINELAVAIEKLINAPEDRKRMGIYSRKKAELEFDQKDVVQKHLEIYETMLKRVT